MTEKDAPLIWLKKHPRFLLFHLGFLALFCVLLLWNWWFNGKLIEDFLEDVLANMVPLFISAVILIIVLYNTQNRLTPLLQACLVFVGFPVLQLLLGMMVASMLWIRGGLDNDLACLIGLSVSLFANFVLSFWLSRKLERGIQNREAARRAAEENQNGQT